MRRNCVRGIAVGAGLEQVGGTIIMAGIMAVPGRTVVRVSGSERIDFLQRLVTNSVSGLSEGEVRYAALLTPQGKYLFDFFIIEQGEAFLLDVAAEQAEALVKRLSLYKLRVDVTFETTDLEVYAAEEPHAEAVSVRDPRHESLGYRLYAPALPDAAEGAAYEARRLDLGIPDLPRDAEVEKTLSLEADLDWLNGVDFTKGCFVGQELTARMKHRGKVRKRLLGVQVEGGMPAPGTPILKPDGKEAGQIRSGLNGRGIALIRLEDLDKGPLTADGRTVTAQMPFGQDG